MTERPWDPAAEREVPIPSAVGPRVMPSAVAAPAAERAGAGSALLRDAIAY